MAHHLEVVSIRADDESRVEIPAVLRARGKNSRLYDNVDWLVEYERAWRVGAG